MPGVPGKGCSSCRKSKKKCDQRQPICSRCQRLDLQCEGSGEQTLKFQDEGPKLRKVTPGHSTTPAQWVMRVPANQSSSTINQFIAILQVSDERYDLSALGGFLAEIPKQIEKNEALFAAVESLNCSFPALHTGQVTPEMYRKYGFALSSMRKSMENLDPNAWSGTLAAMYLLLLSEGWMRILNTSGAHGFAMSHLLQLAESHRWRGGFEEELVLAVCMSIIVESFVNPQIQLGPWFFALLSKFGKSGPSSHTVTILDLGQMPRLIYSPKDNIPEISRLYQLTQADRGKTHQTLITLRSKLASSVTDTYESINIRKQTNRLQAKLGVLLAVAAVLNNLLLIHDPLNTELASDAEDVAQHILELAKAVIAVRPLGASFMPAALLCSWVATQSADTRNDLEKVLMDYESDYAGFHWRAMATWLQRRFDKAKFKAAS